jgi:hypothetical protein
MKMSKIKLEKTVENRKSLLTPNCRKRKSKLGKNAKNLPIERPFVVEKVL